MEDEVAPVRRRRGLRSGADHAASWDEDGARVAPGIHRGVERLRDTGMEAQREGNGRVFV